MSLMLNALRYASSKSVNPTPLLRPFNFAAPFFGRKFSHYTHSVLTTSLFSLAMEDYSKRNEYKHSNKQKIYNNNTLMSSAVICSLLGAAQEVENRLKQGTPKVSKTSNEETSIDKKTRIDLAVKSLLTIPDVAILWKRIEESYGPIIVRPGLENYFKFEIAVAHSGLYKRRSNPTIFIASNQNNNEIKYLILGHLVSISHQEKKLQLKRDLASKLIDTATAKEIEKKINSAMISEIDRLLKTCEAYGIITQPTPSCSINTGPKHDPLQPNLD